MGGGDGVDKVAGINPVDPTDHLVQAVGEWTDDTMVVGHLPFMGKLASRLVTGDEAASVVMFTPGTVVCLERGEQGSWSIAWMIRPELVARPCGEDV